MTDLQHNHDVIVVGSRCAGAATAMLLARQGHDVLVVDRAEPDSDTLSTHAIARSGVVQLNRWGVLDDVLASGAPPIRDAVFHNGVESVHRRIKDRAGVDLRRGPPTSLPRPYRRRRRDRGRGRAALRDPRAGRRVVPTTGG